MLEATLAPGSVADPKVPRGSDLALVPSAVVHRAKSRHLSLAEQVGVHPHGMWTKEQSLHDRAAPVWLSNLVRR